MTNKDTLRLIAFALVVTSVIAVMTLIVVVLAQGVAILQATGH